MSQQLHAAVTEILAMPYFKNEQARSGGATYGHEEAVALRVKSAGFVQVDKTLFPGITKSMLKRLQRKLSFQILGFIGGTQKPISDFNSQLRQYGSTFIFRGRLGRIEKFFWGLICSRYDYPKPSNSYEKLVVILARGRND